MLHNLSEIFIFQHFRYLIMNANRLLTNILRSCRGVQIPKFSRRQQLFSSQNHHDLDKLTSKTTNLLLEHAVSTDDDHPDELGPVDKIKKKPRHIKNCRVQQEPGVDLSDKSVLLFPGQGAQFVGMGY